MSVSIHSVDCTDATPNISFVCVCVCVCMCVCLCTTFMHSICTYQIDSRPLPLLSISIEVVDIHISDSGALNAEDVAQLSGPLTGLMVA